MRKLRYSGNKGNSSALKATRHGSSVSYDSFLFVDNVTNSRIMLKDARKHYDSRKPASKHNLEQQQQLNALSDCLSTLKSTKLFQLDSLRTKLFRSVHARKVSAEYQLQQTKRGLRQLIESSIEELSIRELRQCFADPNHKIDSRIIALQSLSGHKLTKSNIESLLTAPHPKSQTNPNRIKLNRTLEQDSFELKQERELLQQANNYLQNNLKSNSSHLVKPKHNKELYEKLYSACSGKKIPKKAFMKHDQNQLNECQGVFKPIQKGATATALQQKLKNPQVKQPKQKKEIIFAVENNLFFDVQMLIMMNRELVQVKDAQGNNLLHIAAKNRNEQLFAFLLKRAGLNALTSKNNLGRTPQDLANLYGALNIVNICQTYSPYS